MTNKTASFHYVTFIRATSEKVFAAITTPEIAARYWGHSNVSDWTPGAGWQHVRASDGTVQLKGTVVEYLPPRRLVITWANESQAHDPAQVSRVTFEIVPYDGMVKLSVSHDDLIPDSGMEGGIRKGWPIVLSSLKSYLETGTAIDIFAQPAAVPA